MPSVRGSKAALPALLVFVLVSKLVLIGFRRPEVIFVFEPKLVVVGATVVVDRVRVGRVKLALVHAERLVVRPPVVIDGGRVGALVLAPFARGTPYQILYVACILLV